MINYKKLNYSKFLMIVFIFVLVIFTSFCAFAQEEEKEESTVNLSADQVIYDKSTDKMVFTGNVVITQEDIILTALEAEFDVDTLRKAGIYKDR